FEAKTTLDGDIENFSGTDRLTVRALFYLGPNRKILILHLGQSVSLQSNQLADAGSGQIQQFVQSGAVKGLALSGALYLYEASRAGHDDVHIRSAAGIFRIVQIDHRCAIDETNG